MFDWESPELQKQVQDTIGFLTKGWSCKKGCRTKQCGCRKKGHHCGPGCDCHGCTNLFQSTNYQDPADESEDEDEETDHEDFSQQCSSSSVSEDEDGIETEVIMDTFDHLLLEQIDIV